MKLSLLNQGGWLLLLLAGSFSRCASAQVYRLRSLEGVTVSVRVYKEPISLDKPQGRREVSLVCGADTVVIYECWAVEHIQVLKQQFLQLTYAVRGGTDQGLGRTLVVGVSHGKLCQALKVQRYSQSDLYGPHYHHELYRVRLSLLGSTPRTYRFRLNVHDERRSSLDPQHDHYSTTQAVLTFDPSAHLFHTGFQRVPARFPVVDDKTEQVVTLNVATPVPVIKLRNQVRYFIQGEWYGAARPK
jgi:hypothetical protein